MSHQMTSCIKHNSSFQGDQDDLLMSYLNSDYMSITPSWVSLDNTSSVGSNNSQSPPSTPGLTPSAQFTSPIPSPDTRARQGFLDMASYSSVTAPHRNSNGWNQNAASVSGSPSIFTNNTNYYRHHQVMASAAATAAVASAAAAAAASGHFQSNILNEFQQFTTRHSMVYADSHVIYSTPATSTQCLKTISNQPTSPSSLVSYSSSSDSEQPRKKRGRKKRNNSSYSTASSSNSCKSVTPPPAMSPALIAPAPAKLLLNLLPAQPSTEHQSPSPNTNSTTINTEYHASNNKNNNNTSNHNPDPKSSLSEKASLAATTIDSQKAATIAKRQERLIKNRAAALLSRKRKREHLTALEDQRDGLFEENQLLKEQLTKLEKDHAELEKKFSQQQQQQQVKTSQSSSLFSSFFECNNILANENICEIILLLALYCYCYVTIGAPSSTFSNVQLNKGLDNAIVTTTAEIPFTVAAVSEKRYKSHDDLALKKRIIKRISF